HLGDSAETALNAESRLRLWTAAGTFRPGNAGSTKMSSEGDPIDLALREDIGAGDVTTTLLVPDDSRAHARILPREKAMIGGTMTAAEVFRRVDTGLKISVELTDGTAVLGGETILKIQGAARSILTAERVALNFLQRLSGIATLTHEYVEAIGKNPAKIMDTRKTTPGLRALERAAVVDVILLDNMETAEMRGAIALGRKHNVKFEASGGINLRTVRRIAATGVDYISVGALTHSPRAIDLSLELTHVGS